MKNRNSRIISIILCVILCISLWHSTKQMVVSNLEYSANEETQIKNNPFEMLVNLFSMSDYMKLQESPSLIENQNIHINVQSIIEDDYLDALNIFILYETEGYTNAIYEITHNLESGLFHMKVIGAYEVLNDNLQPISPKITSIGYKTDIFSECGWYVKSKIFSPLKRYVYIIQLYTITPHTINRTEIPCILKNLQFIEKGYF